MGYVREPRLQMVAFVIDREHDRVLFLPRARAAPARSLAGHPGARARRAGHAGGRPAGGRSQGLHRAGEPGLLPGGRAERRGADRQAGVRLRLDRRGRGAPRWRMPVPGARRCSDGTPLRNGFVRLEDSAGKARSFLVNCSAVAGRGQEAAGRADQLRGRHRAAGEGGRAAPGQGGRRGGQPHQKRVPGQHEPRTSHSVERDYRDSPRWGHHKPGARRRAPDTP